RVRGSKIMRGRPITLEEFERMLAAVPAIVENTAANSWNFYLRGLWASGLRLSESLTLRWDNAPGGIVVDLDGRRPMLRIPAAAQKANRDTLLPITPDFAALLQSVPEGQRRGRVFKLLALDGTLLPATRRLVGPTVSTIGEKAGVVVDERMVGGKTVRKFASAHDLRRAFGQRWAAKVMPNVLRELMRHTDIGTTMKFYVGQNAETTADAVWKSYSGTIEVHSNESDTANTKSA
ncbi:MAG TPA: tyrosine-type recombinase/integrase, partial [Lacipirellulaceae bacterium]